jgi:hypothetical protein
VGRERDYEVFERDLAADDTKVDVSDPSTEALALGNSRKRPLQRGWQSDP